MPKGQYDRAAARARKEAATAKVKAVRAQDEAPLPLINITKKDDTTETAMLLISAFMARSERNADIVHHYITTLGSLNDEYGRAAAFAPRFSCGVHFTAAVVENLELRKSEKDLVMTSFGLLYLDIRTPEDAEQVLGFLHA